MGKSLGTPLNTIFSWFIKKRIHQIELFIKFPNEVQLEVFNELIANGSSTEFGKKHRFAHIKTVKDFQKAVPLQDYEALFPYVERLMNGEQNLLWNSSILWFAKSSGTTSQRSKLIPVSLESLENCHYKGGKDLLALYYQHHPHTKLFKGKHLIIGGSSQINPINTDSYFGDLSAIIVNNLPWWCEWRRTPSKDITLMEQWDEKLHKMAQETVKEDVMILAGVPSWTLVLLRKIMEQEKVTNIMDVWPNLELYMHGGVSFEPYKNQFSQIIQSKSMNYVQTYNASEGFFGIQDTLTGEDMLLMLDYGIFYEFIPMSDLNDLNSETVLLNAVELNVNYAMVISTNAGLWRYLIGDTVQFTNLSPYRIKVTGRTTEYINAFGEELIVSNTDNALKKACEILQCSVFNYTVCPRIFSSKQGGYHQWLIEFTIPPKDLSIFVNELDNQLKLINSDYEAKRAFELNLQLPQVHILQQGVFEKWLKSKGKLGGQHKIPRLKNDSTLVDEICTYTI